MVRCPRCGGIIPDGETECTFCRKDVTRVMNRPPQDRARRYRLDTDERVQKSWEYTIGYTGFWRRLGAAAVDICFALALIFLAKAACESQHEPALIPTAMLLAAVFYLLILIPFLTSTGYRASPGKVLCGMVVTDMNGRTLSFPQAVLREFGKYLSFLALCLGFILIGFTEKKQGLHDLLALTVVVPRSEAHLLLNLTPVNSIEYRRGLLFGRIITGGVILISLLVLGYFGFVLHETVTPNGLAAHSLVLAADSVADTKYPVYSLPLYDTALDLQPNATQFLVRKVQVLQGEGRYDEARTCLNKAMIANPNDPVPIIANGDLLYGDGQYQSAIQYYEKALGMDRKAAAVWIKKGDAYLAMSVVEMQGMREKYKTLTGKSAGATPQSDAATMDAFRSTDSYREAIKSYNEAIRIDPLLSVEISGRVLASTKTLVTTYQGILDDIGIDTTAGATKKSNG
jgi:uncharacterized RDD family membrane protein YckC